MSLVFNPIDNVNFPQMGNFSLVSQEQVNLATKIGSTLYVRLQVTNAPPGVFQQPIIYKSTDNGVSWSIENVTYPGSSFFAYVLGDLRVDGSTLRTIENQSNSITAPATIGFNVYTPGSGWGSIETIGGGFSPKYYPTSGSGQGASVRQCVRSDGSRIVIYSVQNGSGDLAISVLKLSAGTWTQIVLLDEVYASNPGDFGVDYFLDTVHQIGDEIHIFFGRRHFGPLPNRLCDSCHVSISAADAVGTLQVLDGNVEVNNPAARSLGRADSSADGNTIAFTFGSHVFTSAPGYMRAAIGDMTSSSLNPTWTLETIPSSSVFGPFPSIPAGVSFQGGNTLNVYWFDGKWNVGSGWALTTASRLGVGSWSALSVLYGPTVANYTGAGALMAFDLLNAFVGGVGILLQLGDATGFSPIVQYAGPAVAAASSYNFLRQTKAFMTSLSGG